MKVHVAMTHMYDISIGAGRYSIYAWRAETCLHVYYRKTRGDSRLRDLIQVAHDDTDHLRDIIESLIQRKRLRPSRRDIAFIINSVLVWEHGVSSCLSVERKQVLYIQLMS